MRYDDFVLLIEALGFRKSRSSGSHSIYRHPAISEFLCIQDFKGEAKPYQIAQFFALVEKYTLGMEE